MDPKLFEQRLTEVAEWRRPVVEQEITVEIPAEDPDQEPKVIKFTEQRILESAPPEILHVKGCAETCGDCGMICNQGRSIDYKQHLTHGRLHWRKLCQSCGMGWNPLSEKWDIPRSQMGLFFASYLRERKGLYPTKYSPKKNTER